MEIPDPVRQCFSGDSEVVAHVVPKGMAMDSLISARIPLRAVPGAKKRPPCLRLPQGEPLDVVVGDKRKSFVVEEQSQAVAIP